MPLLAHTVHRVDPFPYFTADAAVGNDTCRRLLAAFDGGLPWVRHDSFYHCHLAHLGDRVPADLRAGLRDRVRALTGLDLVETVTATAQRMAPGDHALAHTDRPLVGFECVRLVLQVDGDGDPDDGGLFQALADADGTHVVRTHAPRRDTAVGFVMTPTSHHAVTPTRRTRHTVVFHFQHRANGDAVARFVEGLLGDCRFDALPAALGPVATEAETTLPEEVTLRAALTATALHRWGFDADAVVAAYRSAVGAPVALDAATAAAVRLAAWATRLHLDDFDLEAWRALAAALDPVPPDPRLAEAWAVLLPAATPVVDPLVYKIATPAQVDALRAGPWAGAPVDVTDGFVHFSARHQVAGTLAKHFAGAGPLWLLGIDPDRLPSGALRWEVSRGGERFPHLYAPLEAAAWTTTMELASPAALPSTFSG